MVHKRFRPLGRVAALGAALLAGMPVFAASTLQPPLQLNCDQQSNPLAVSAPRPRFSWMLTAASTEARGVRFARMENGSPVFRVASGRYHFTMPASQGRR